MKSEIAFFPKDNKVTLNLIATMLYEMVEDRASLERLIKTACGAIPQWTAFAQLRAIYCGLGFCPRDGITLRNAIKGLSIESPEQRYMEREAELTEARLSWYRGAARRALPGDVALFTDLPPLKEIPPPKPFMLKRKRGLKKLETELDQIPRRPTRSEEEKARLIRELEEQLRRNP